MRVCRDALPASPLAIVSSCVCMQHTNGDLRRLGAGGVRSAAGLQASVDGSRAR